MTTSLKLARQFVQAGEGYLSGLLKDLGVTPRQLSILEALEHPERNVTQRIISERTLIDRSTLSEMIRRMQKKGLLERKRVINDERAWGVKLTPAGTTVMVKARRLAESAEKFATPRLPKELRASIEAFEGHRK